MYDVIVVGARAAGAVTAMLLARADLNVLVLDRVSFPSDTLSTHQVQLPAVARLDRWGLLGQVVASGAPSARRVRFDQGDVVLTGSFPAVDGVDALYSPRRTVLDSILVEAARAAGAEVREDFTARELVTDGAGRVTGVRGHLRNRADVVERANVVIGADGKHSMVAAAVGSTAYHEKSPLTMGSYTYWADLPLDGGEIYGREDLAVGAWPTNDGLTMTFVSRPASAFGTFRTDVEGQFRSALDQCGDLGVRARAARRVERFRSTPDLPNFFRVPGGPGWALVGDAGLTVDPISGHGISDAFRDAELLAQAVEAGLGGRRPLEGALAHYRRARDRSALPMYRFTTELASFGPQRPEQALLFAALAESQQETDRFLGVLTGAVPLCDYLTPANLLHLIGPAGMAKVIMSRVRRRRAGAVREPAVESDRAVTYPGRR